MNSRLTFSHRMADVQMPVMGYVADLIRQNPGTISLGQGMVHYGPPREALDAARTSMDYPGTHQYGYVIGRTGLRDAFKDKLLRENELDPGFEVVVTAGSNQAFFEAILAITDPGDEVILLVPYYFNHEMAVRIASCTPVLVPVDGNLAPDLDAISDSISPRTRAIVTVSPNNPTGLVYDPAVLQAINALCAQHGLFHISDEAYEYFTFAGSRHYSPGSASGAHAHTFSLYSMSKAFGMAGWRLGYMALPPGLLASVRKIQDTNPICPPLVSQAAALGALEAGRAYCEQFLEPMSQVRTLVMDQLRALEPRISVSPSTGAFYVLIKVNTELDARALTTRLIQDHKVAVIPGDTFGATDGTYLRIAYGALQPATLAEAVGRLSDGLRALAD